jgi:hypothetical protein
MTNHQPMQGTWKVQEISQDRFSLTMQASAGLVGGAPPGTIVLRVVDNDTLLNEAEGYQAVRIR